MSALDPLTWLAFLGGAVCGAVLLAAALAAVIAANLQPTARHPPPSAPSLTRDDSFLLSAAERAHWLLYREPQHLADAQPAPAAEFDFSALKAQLLRDNTVPGLQYMHVTDLGERAPLRP